MATDKQIHANRLNAQKCTGPRSPEGKATSCMNALKTGIAAESRIIRGEYEDQLRELSREYYSRWVPTTPEQRCLVDSLIEHEWLLRRLHRVETQLWDAYLPEDARIPESTELGLTFGRAAKQFQLLQYRINSTTRHFRQALQDLERLQPQAVLHDPCPVQPQDCPLGQLAPRHVPAAILNFYYKDPASMPDFDPPQPRKLCPLLPQTDLAGVPGVPSGPPPAAPEAPPQPLEPEPGSPQIGFVPHISPMVPQTPPSDPSPLPTDHSSLWHD